MTNYTCSFLACRHSKSTLKLLNSWQNLARANYLTKRFTNTLSCQPKPLPHPGTVAYFRQYSEYSDHRDRTLQLIREESTLLKANITTEGPVKEVSERISKKKRRRKGMADSQPPGSPSKTKSSSTGGHDKPLVVGRKKPTDTSPTATMDSDTNAALNHSIAKNVQSNTTEAAPAEEQTSSTTTGAKDSKKKDKPPKQPKQPKAAPPTAPLTPALIDLRVGHILRAIPHPNADSLYVSTIAMGDASDAEHTTRDEETGQTVRTVCSGLNGLVPLAEMQDRKVIVVANLKPVTMRGIKSAAMVLAASPATKEGDDPHAADRVVELVSPPGDAEAGDKVYFEGWPYGEGRGPEKQLNPKKKVWEGIQPGFYTGEDCVVAFDAKKSEVGGEEKGDLIVEGRGKCTVKSLKGAVVR